MDADIRKININIIIELDKSTISIPITNNNNKKISLQVFTNEKIIPLNLMLSLTTLLTSLELLVSKKKL